MWWVAPQRALFILSTIDGKRSCIRVYSCHFLFYFHCTCIIFLFVVFIIMALLGFLIPKRKWNPYKTFLSCVSVSQSKPFFLRTRRVIKLIPPGDWRSLTLMIRRAICLSDCKVMRDIKPTSDSDNYKLHVNT